MNSETSLEELLARPCIADTSLLCNFVYTGYADLLLQLVGEPLFLSPTILDEVEATQLELEQLPSSEFLKPLYLARQPGYGSLPRSSSLYSEFCREGRQFVEPQFSFHR